MGLLFDTRLIRDINDNDEIDQCERDMAVAMAAFERVLEVLDRMELKYSKDFKEPAWPYHQAYTLGYNSLLDDLKKLVTIQEKG